MQKKEMVGKLAQNLTVAYTDFIAVKHSVPGAFHLYLGNINPENAQEVIFNVRTWMPPHVAKALIGVMQAQVAKYEALYGAIPDYSDLAHQADSDNVVSILTVMDKDPENKG